MLALLLARKGVRVTLLEAHEDFDRDFRGDTLHPSVLELMDELGLVERLHQLPHSKIHTGTIMTDEGPTVLADFRRLKTRYPYIMMIPQKDFLAFIVEEAKRHPSFNLLMGARVEVVDKAAWTTYDRMLKSQGVEEGVQSYSRVIQLLLGTNVLEAQAPRLKRQAPTP